MLVVRETFVWIAAVSAVCLLWGCHDSPAPKPQPSSQRINDQIVIAGQRLSIGTPVVLWSDPGGYDAYQTKASTLPNGPRKGPRYGARVDRFHNGTPDFNDDQRDAARDGDWTPEQLRDVVDQLVIHYDATGLSRECFKVLQEERGLSAHFLLDIDGTIYQTLDLQERAWHAGVSNSRSIGIEIAHVGAFDTNATEPTWRDWYAHDKRGRLYIAIPEKYGDGGVRTPNFVGRPARETLIHGTIQGRRLEQYDFTNQQYEALIKLAAALNRIFPDIRLDAPRDSAGHVIPHILTPTQLRNFRGIVAHYHVSDRKIDPGPAFDWDRLILGARR